MRCKLHPLDPGVGVCAVCLRDRLHALIALQSSYHSQLDSVSSTPSHWKHDQEPHPPLPFPRSVSPFVSHRRSIASAAAAASSSSPFHSHSHLFYSTPQLTTTTTTTTSSKKKKSSLFSTLFRFRSDEPRCPSDVPPAEPLKPSSSSSGWFSSWRSGRKSSGRSEEVGGSTTVRSVGRRDRGQCRGMSPSDEEEGGEIYVSSPEWRIPAPTPIRRNPKHHHHGGSGSQAMSGFAVCLSPLVRASPQRRSQVVAGEVGFSGEIRSGPKFDGYDGIHRQQSYRRRGSGGSVPPVNRSRKLCDIGRFY